MNWNNIGIVSWIFLGIMFTATYILSNMQSFNLVWLIGAVFFFIMALSGLYGKNLFSSKVYKIIGIPLVIIEIFLVCYVFLNSAGSFNFTIIILSITVLPFILIFIIFFVNLWLKTRKQRKGLNFLKDLKYNEALEFFEEYVKFSPNDPLAWSGKAFSLFPLNKPEEALECANKAMGIKLGFKYFLIEKNIQLIQITTKAVALCELEKFADALKCTDILLKLRPKDSEILSLKGIILCKLEDYEGALEFLDEALRLHPKDPHVLNNKGYTLMNMGNYSEAMEYIDKALDINPKIPNIWLSKGETLRGMNKNEEALECIDKALELDPIFKNAIKAKEELLKR